MRKIFATSLVIASAMTATAHAHPGAPILTTGSKAPRAAMTAGASYENVNGVHLFHGSSVPAHEELAGATLERRVEINIEINRKQFRHTRHLRTQGFYSGNRYPSRRFTQGFYSGQ